MAARPKLLNDPVYGFIQLRHADFTKVLDHPWVQRMRRISQLGLSHLVYPGAVHNRFHHAVGALHLMQEALDSLREKGVAITEEEYRGACLAILLHDVGHGPFSHALEHTIVRGVHHEEISTLIMNALNAHFNGMLDVAIEIFNDHHPKGFLHDLVSSQLDMDRMDYLRRDSFFTGVTEGHISSERIIRMLNVHEGRLVVEEKGIYSIEKFIISRRLMYWQVYLHKTVLSAEWRMMRILERAGEIARRGQEVWATPAIAPFLNEDLDRARFIADTEVLAGFCSIDDNDVMCCIKAWQQHEDVVLSELCQRLVERRLFKIELRDQPFDQNDIEERLNAVSAAYEISMEEASYFVLHDRIDNRAYSTASHGISMLYKDGSVQDVAAASDHLNLSALSMTVERHFLAYPKEMPPRPQ